MIFFCFYIIILCIIYLFWFFRKLLIFNLFTTVIHIISNFRKIMTQEKSKYIHFKQIYIIFFDANIRNMSVENFIIKNVHTTF